jgi:hypothetical protein
MTKLKPLPPDLLERTREDLWQRAREALIKACPGVSEDKIREMFWQEADNARLQAIYERA